MKYNAVIPELTVSDLESSKFFYLDVIGFKLDYQREEDKFIFISFDEAQLMLEESSGNWVTGKLSYPFGRGINLQITVGDVAKIAQKIKTNKLPIYKDLFESRYENNEEIILQKELLVQDPDGYLLRFSELINSTDQDSSDESRSMSKQIA